MKTFVQMLSVALFGIYLIGCSPESAKKINASGQKSFSKIECSIFGEIERLVLKTHASGSIVNALSGELLDEIGKDPKKILVGLVVFEAKNGWPGISKSDGLDLISEARTNSTQALENLKQILRRNANMAIAEAGHNPKKENWDNNNTATAILFCYWPKAELKGKESRFLREYISGQREYWTQWIFN